MSVYHAAHPRRQIRHKDQARWGHVDVLKIRIPPYHLEALPYPSIR